MPDSVFYNFMSKAPPFTKMVVLLLMVGIVLTIMDLIKRKM